MENIIKVGLGVMIKNENKVLLGHRAKNRKDTGGIFEPDSWTFPGGKQEYNETMGNDIQIQKVWEKYNILSFEE